MIHYLDKILTLEQAKEVCHRMKDSHRSIVFTNGCFDILHPGHTRYLFSARELGDFLLVAVNSDRSVRAIKGPKRPIFGERARAELLAALYCVDAVLVFDEDNPLRVIQHLVPNILVKGGDWSEDDIVGADVVRGAGGQVRRIDYVPGFSTTDVLKRVAERHV